MGVTSPHHLVSGTKKGEHDPPPKRIGMLTPSQRTIQHTLVNLRCQTTKVRFPYGTAQIFRPADLRLRLELSLCWALMLCPPVCSAKVVRNNPLSNHPTHVGHALSEHALIHIWPLSEVFSKPNLFLGRAVPQFI